MFSIRKFPSDSGNVADKLQSKTLALTLNICCRDGGEEKVLLTQIHKHMHHAPLTGSNLASLPMTEPAVDPSGQSHFFHVYLQIALAQLWLHGTRPVSGALIG